MLLYHYTTRRSLARAALAKGANVGDQIEIFPRGLDPSFGDEIFRHPEFPPEYSGLWLTADGGSCVPNRGSEDQWFRLTLFVRNDDPKLTPWLKLRPKILAAFAKRNGTVTDLGPGENDWFLYGARIPRVRFRDFQEMPEGSCPWWIETVPEEEFDNRKVEWAARGLMRVADWHRRETAVARKAERAA